MLLKRLHKCSSTLTHIYTDLKNRAKIRLSFTRHQTSRAVSLVEIKICVQRTIVMLLMNTSFEYSLSDCI